MLERGIQVKHEGGDETEDEEGLEGSGRGIWRSDDPPHRCDHYRSQSQEGSQVDEEHDGQIDSIREKGETDSGKNPVNHKLTVGNEQDKKGPEDNEVIDSEGATHDPFLAEGKQQRFFNTPYGVAESILGDSDSDQRKAAVTAPAKKNERCNQQRSEDGRCRCHNNLYRGWELGSGD